MRKMNAIFKGKHIGLPLIGAGLAGGDWEVIKNIIQTELADCNVTIVHYDGTTI
jgi:O-acetyl-ADP-ribose deacetylase (regulator of RNase III)